MGRTGQVRVPVQELFQTFLPLLWQGTAFKNDVVGVILRQHMEMNHIP